MAAGLHSVPSGSSDPPVKRKQFFFLLAIVIEDREGLEGQGVLTADNVRQSEVKTLSHRSTKSHITVSTIITCCITNL